MKKLSSIILFILVLTSVELVQAQCTASFIFIDNGGGNFSFSSTTTSSGVIYNNWDFDDGSGSTGFTLDDDTISYPYIANGNYNVSLITQDSISGCTDTIVQTITVTSGNPCSASFIYNINGQNVNFISTSTSDSSAIINYWDFGDGNNASSNDTMMTHSYSSAGNYTVSLAMVDSLSGCSDTTYQTININTGCGTPNFTYIDNLNGSVSFVNTSTNASNYTWDFGNGNTSTQISPTFYYQPAGTYFVCLTINDSCNNVFCDSVVVTDTLATPCSGTAAFTFIDNGGGNISFNNISTNAVSPFWTFGDGGTSLSYSPNNTYSTDGNYLVVLTITDSSNTCTSSVSQMVPVTGALNVCSSASFTSTDNGSGLWSFASTTNGSPINYMWNFGDGTYGSGQSPNHLYTSDGIYVVALTIFDSILGCSNSNNSIITVSGATGGNPCNAAFVITYDSISSSVLIYNTSTGINLNYNWDFGDGNSSTLQNPNYVYGGNGPYNLCLTVNDGNGCASTYCDSIFGGGTVFKQAGFSISVINPVVASVFNEKNSNVGFNFYPNPVKDELTINFEIKRASSVEIYATDLLGNIVANIVNQKNIEGVQRVKWSTKSIPNGIYLLNVKTENSLQVKKVIVSR